MSEKRSKKRIFIGLAAVLLVILLAAGAVLYPQLKKQWTAPLGPALELPTYTPDFSTPKASATLALPTREPVAEEVSALIPATSLPEVTATRASTPTAAPLCGGPPSMVILGIGADSGIDYRYGLADVMRIARVDFVNAKVSVLSMPRDFWVEIPGISDHGITHGKLNQSYFYGGSGMGYYDGPGEGPGLLARTLDLNFGLRADQYGAVNMQTFVKIVDAVGGIDIYLPNDVDGSPIDDRTEDMGYFNAGQQHFTGDEALRFARIRKRYNDFTRMDHQTMVLCALKEKVASPSVLPKIPQIISAFQGSVLTDLSPEQISQLACLLPHVKSENLLFTSLPQELLEPGRVYSPILKKETFILEADYDVIRDYIDQFMEGSWPSESKESSCP